MSFGVDLWDGFEIIKSGISLNQKRVKYVFDILVIYSCLQKDYYQGIENLLKDVKEVKEVNPDDNRKSTVDEALNTLMSSFKEENELFKNHNNYVNKIIEGLKECLEKNNCHEYFKDNIQNTELFNQSLNIVFSN